MALNLTSIKKAEIFEHDKGEIEELNNATLKYFFVSEKDGEKLVSFTIHENDRFYFASGSLKNFLIDNICNAFTDDNNNLSFTEVIKIGYTGKVRTKNGRMCNTWCVKVEEGINF